MRRTIVAAWLCAPLAFEASAQQLPQRSDQVCSVATTMVRQQETIPGARAIWPLERSARSAWADVTVALDQGLPVDPARYATYLRERRAYDRALAPLIDDIPVSEAGARQFFLVDSLTGALGRCIEKEGLPSAIADRMRRKARDLTPIVAAMWRDAAASTANDADFARRVPGLAASGYWTDDPEVGPLVAALTARAGKGGEQIAAATRAKNAQDAADINNAIAARQDRLRRAQEEVRGRVQARADAERRGAAAGLRVSSLAIRGLPLGSYPTPEAITAAAEEAFGCQAGFPVRTSETGTGGDRDVTAGCSAFGLISPYMSAVYRLRDYRLVEVRETLWPGDYKNCYAIPDERQRASFANRARQMEAAGWRLVERKPVEQRTIFGTPAEPWQVNVYRRDDVTLVLSEVESRVIDLRGRCAATASFQDRIVSARYSLR